MSFDIVLMAVNDYLSVIDVSQTNKKIKEFYKMV